MKTFGILTGGDYFCFRPTYLLLVSFLFRNNEDVIEVVERDMSRNRLENVCM